MSLRPFALPKDIPTLLDVIPRAFQYPEHPAWGVQSDEIANIMDSMKMIRRIWPIFAALSLVTPSVRDAMRGYIWEEDGCPVGLVNVMRQGTSQRWYIGNVAVLPEYRRRGLARALVEAAVKLSVERGGKAVALDVITDNLPARQLYEKLGFEHFADSMDFDYLKDSPPLEVALPAGYTTVPLSEMDWRTRYELDRRLKPADVQKYQPVEISSYRPSLFVRLLIPLLNRVAGKTVNFAIHYNQQVVARGHYSGRTRPGGVNNMSLRLDPAHAALASYLVAHIVRSIWQFSPGRRIEYSVPSWQGMLCEAAQAAGFTLRHMSQSMGKTF